MSFRSLPSTRLASRCFSTQTKYKRTALYDLHVAHKGKMVPFAGWDMPLLYADQSIGASAVYTRKAASLFDVSHMLQTRLYGKDRIAFMEQLVVADLKQLPLHSSTLSVFMNAQGGIVDDTILNQQQDHLYIVSNAGCADKDLAYLRQHLKEFKGDARLEVIQDQSLLALQGPKAAGVLETLCKENLSSFGFMSTRKLTVAGIPCHVSRSGYTGEDGFEIQVPSSQAISLAEILLKNDEVKLSGLGARDTLRLEAGMCLYGHDLDDETSPVEASLTWTIGKRRRTEGGFLGANVVLEQLKNGCPRKRVGLTVEGAPVREGAAVFDMEGNPIGKVTSGCPSPNLNNQNIAMAYVKTGSHKMGTAIQVKGRQKMQPGKLIKMPFVPSRYHK